MGPAQPKLARKRNRKRKRRVISDSSSSDSEDTSTSSSDSVAPTAAVELDKTTTVPDDTDSVGESEDESSSSSSPDESSDESQDDSDQGVVEDGDISAPSPRKRRHEPIQRDSPSPQPTVELPPFVSPDTSASEQSLREKFRKFWMAAIADGFKDDLEEIRKEPNLGPSRLAVLIDSLASGADVFSSSSTDGRVNEMEVVLDQLP